MEFKGDEFLKNVQVKQEEEILRQRLGEFDNLRQNNGSNPYTKEYVNSDPYNDNELGDILLQNSNSDHQDNKKKYIVLGIALVLLFVITIVIIRLISTDSTSNDVKPQEQAVLDQDKALNDDKIQQEYQQILNDKLKKVDGAMTQLPDNANADVKTLESQEESLPVKEEQANPLNIKDEPAVMEEPEQVIKTAPKTVKKEVVQPKATPAPTTKPTATSSAKGLFVQIGAYSQKPTEKFLADIEAKGFTYKMYSVTVKGQELTKLLIGPYKSRTDAQNNLSTIRKTFGAPGAFILEL